MPRFCYYVALIVSDGKSDANNKGVRINYTSIVKDDQFSRMTKTVSFIFKKAKDLDGDIYHLHDPELIPIGLEAEI